MNDTLYTIEIPPEDRVVVVPEEERRVEVPGEWRSIEISRGNDMMVSSKQHTAGDTRKWVVDYSHWLENTSDIEQVDVQSSSATCTVGNVSILGPEVVFYLIGGTLGERLTVTLLMTDKVGNIKTDSMAFTCVAP